MNTANPFSTRSRTDTETLTIIHEVLQGDKNALNSLLTSHQDYVFNIAMKMLNHIQDAEDATQEVLIKIVSNLAKYDPSKARFTTWAYRITFNHILNFRKSEIEKRELTFENFFEFIGNLPDEEINAHEEEFYGISIEEARITCTAGMLMCLNREQRLLYLVGEIFKIDHNLASEIFDISPANFRKKLSRARGDIHQWMHKKCGLVNLKNPCRCKRKTKKFIELGIVNPDDLKWQSNYTHKINELISDNIQESLIESDRLYAEFHRDVPFKKSLKAGEIYDKIVKNRILSRFIDPLAN